MNLKNAVFSVAVWTFVAITWIVFFPIFFVIWLLAFPFDRHNVASRKATSLWSIFYIRINPKWKIRITGKEKLNRKKPRVIISNHQSLIDIVVLFDVYAHQVWVSKKENFYVPILGWVMQLNRYVKLDRENPKSFPKMFADCAKVLKRGESLIVFPEGTRSRTGELGRFKEGAFKMAIENKVPIIPIVLDGTHTLLPKKGAVMKTSQEVDIHVLDEVPYENFPTHNISELRDYFKNMIAEELRKIRESKKSQS